VNRNNIRLFVQVNLNFEVEKLRAELRHAHEMYAVAQVETLDASRKVGLKISLEKDNVCLIKHTLCV